MMAALDWVRAWMDEEGGSAYRETARLTAELRQRWPSLRGGVELDPTRFVWTVPDGPAAQAALEAQGVYPEMNDAGHVVFILTCQDGPAELERLERAMEQVKLSTRSDPDVETLPPPPFPEEVCAPGKRCSRPGRGCPSVKRRAGSRPVRSRPTRPVSPFWLRASVSRKNIWPICIE